MALDDADPLVWRESPSFALACWLLGETALPWLRLLGLSVCLLLWAVVVFFVSPWWLSVAPVVGLLAFVFFRSLRTVGLDGEYITRAGRPALSLDDVQWALFARTQLKGRCYRVLVLGVRNGRELMFQIPNNEIDANLDDYFFRMGIDVLP